MEQRYEPETDPSSIVGQDLSDDTYAGAVSPPIFQTSIFSHDTVSDMRAALSCEARGLLYTRGNNPTIRTVERKIAALEHAEDARLFASGVAAMAGAVMAHVSRGDHVVCVSGAYGWTRHLFETYLARFDVAVTMVDGAVTDEIRSAIRSTTTVIVLESPTSMRFEVQDLEPVAAMARARGITTIIDNTWATPLFQNPLDWGIDIVVHSVSKYLAGHSDVVAGCIAGRAATIDRIFTTELIAMGAVTTPMQAWLILRGLRTLPVRVHQHQRNTREVVAALKDHPAVAAVNYPTDPDGPQYRRACKYLSGGTGLFSFRLKDRRARAIESFVDALTVPRIAISWGGYESLVFPAIAKVPPTSAELDDATALIRIHVGLEDPAALIADLKRAAGALTRPGSSPDAPRA